MAVQAKIGLALSGGGVRGLAHLGVLDILEQAQVPIHCMAGTSMGGLIVGTYAAGVPLSELIDFATRFGIADLAAPSKGWRGLFGPTKITRLLTELLGSDTLTFEDLRFPVAVVATDIETGEAVVLNRGPLIPALLATSAFPLIFAPVRYEGRWLVDGGVVNNFPVDVVRTLGADRVIGVDTPPRVTLAVHEEEDQARAWLSARALFSFNSRTLDWKQPLLIAETAVGFTIAVVNRARLLLSPPDVLIKVDCPNVGTFATDQSAAVIEAGRKAALAQIKPLTLLHSRPLEAQWVRRWRSYRRRLGRAWRMLRQPEYPCFPFAP